jgi:hypothetical protein
MPRTKVFRDLIVWQKAMELARLVYLETEHFPQSETFGLRMQLRFADATAPVLGGGREPYRRRAWKVFRCRVA